MPALETQRLQIRPLTIDDLAAIHQILDHDLASGSGSKGSLDLDQRRQWLRWTVLGYDQLASLHQPPYGERAVTLKDNDQLIGAVGFVPCLDAFGQLPTWRQTNQRAGPSHALRTSTEFGLFYAIAPSFQRQGFATEAAAAMIDAAFTRLGLHRVIATTSYDNAASIRVMRKIGMRLERNPYSDPPWLQIVGILQNPIAADTTSRP